MVIQLFVQLSQLGKGFTVDSGKLTIGMFGSIDIRMLVGFEIQEFLHSRLLLHTRFSPIREGREGGWAGEMFQMSVQFFW